RRRRERYRLTPKGQEGAMARRHFTQLPSHQADGLRQFQARSREGIDSVCEMVRGSRRTIRDAREAIERADAVLARRLSEQSLGFPARPPSGYPRSNNL